MSRMPAIAGEGRGLRIAFLVALGLGQAGAAGIAAFATRETFSALRQAGGELPLLALTAIAVAGAVIAGLRWGERLVAEHLGQDYVAALRLCLFDHVAQLPAGTIARQRTGAMSLRFVGDLSAVRVWVSLGLGRLLSAALVLPTMIGVLYLLDRGFGLAAGVLFGIAIVAILALGPQLRAVHRRLRSQRARLAADVAERLPHAPHLRLLGRFQHERERLLEQTRPLVAVFCERQRRAALLRVIPDVAQGATATVILWIAFYSGATPAEAAGGLAAVALMVHPLRDFATIWDKHAAWHCAKRRCQALLASPTLPQAGSETLLEPAPKFALHSPAIKLNSVHQGPLRALDLDLRPGEKIGISGRNGSGKSTLLALCAGLETPERGEVRIAGRDPARLPDVERQQLIAFCGPRSPVLSGSLRRALTLGLRRRPSDAVISSRARQLGLGALLDRPGGLDSRVTEAGRNLSAGELRRLLLTRVALSDAPLLLLDEPDEGLDQTGRRELVQLLQEREATVILVSHDPELLASLDRTYCIREGRLVESSPPVSPGTANRKRGKTAGAPLAKRAEPIATPVGKSSQHCDLTRSSIAPLGLLSFLLLILMQASPAAGQPSDVLAQLQHRATLAVDYLHRSVDDNGRFVYKRDQAGRPQGQRYNLLRHAGTLWAMCDYHREVPATSKQAATLQRAARFLVDCCLAPAGEADAGLALWSYPQVTGKPDAPEQAKLGGAGLALAAFAGVEALQPSTIQGDHLRGLGSFIRWMQRTDGSFYSKLIPSRGGRNADWVSLYYPGEAVLGLLLLYDDDGDRRWLEAALDALRYLARSREQSTLVPADHWALIATARVFGLPTETLNAALPQALPWTAPVALRSPAAQVPTNADVSTGSSDNADAHVSVSIGAWGDVGVSEARSLLLGHATSIIDSILAEQIGLEDGITMASGNAPRSCLRGGFDPDGRTAPTATRLEGLLAALTFLPAGERRQRVDRAVASGMAFLTGAQLLTGPNRGGVPRFAPACKSSNRRAHEVRIDDVQHSLSAMLAYRRYIARNHDGAPPHPRSDAAGKRPLD